MLRIHYIRIAVFGSFGLIASSYLGVLALQSSSVSILKNQLAGMVNTTYINRISYQTINKISGDYTFNLEIKDLDVEIKSGSVINSLLKEFPQLSSSKNLKKSNHLYRVKMDGLVVQVNLFGDKIKVTPTGNIRLVEIDNNAAFDTKIITKTQPLTAVIGFKNSLVFNNKSPIDKIQLLAGGFESHDYINNDLLYSFESFQAHAVFNDTPLNLLKVAQFDNIALKLNKLKYEAAYDEQIQSKHSSPLILSFLGLKGVPSLHALESTDLQLKSTLTHSKTDKTYKAIANFALSRQDNAVNLNSSGDVYLLYNALESEANPYLLNSFKLDSNMTLKTTDSFFPYLSQILSADTLGGGQYLQILNQNPNYTVVDYNSLMASVVNELKPIKQLNLDINFAFQNEPYMYFVEKLNITSNVFGLKIAMKNNGDVKPGEDELFRPSFADGQAVIESPQNLSTLMKNIHNHYFDAYGKLSPNTPYYNAARVSPDFWSHFNQFLISFAKIENGGKTYKFEVKQNTSSPMPTINDKNLESINNLFNTELKPYLTPQPANPGSVASPTQEEQTLVPGQSPAQMTTEMPTQLTETGVAPVPAMVLPETSAPPQASNPTPSPQVPQSPPAPPPSQSLPSVGAGTTGGSTGEPKP